MTAPQRSIYYMMQIPGYALCCIDGGLGIIRQLFRRSACDSMGKLEDVVNRPAESLRAVWQQEWRWRVQVFRSVEDRRVS